MGEIFKVKTLDFSVAILATLSVLLGYWSIPVWSLFIGWAWYYVLGGTIAVFRQATLPMIIGSLLAVLCFIVDEALSPHMNGFVAMMIPVFITVVLLMMSLKIPSLNYSLPAFNAYSCIFVGYPARAYLTIEGMPPLLNAFIWITGANFLGLIFGWLSLEFEKFLKSARM